MRKLLFIFAAVLLGSIGLHAENYIIYYAPRMLLGYEGSLIIGETTFGPPITTMRFGDGQGTITCDGTITKIGDKAFRECTSLTSVAIPNSVTTIGKQAFYRCSGLTSITIPASVTSIGEQAFDGSSTSLTSIVVADGNPKYDSRDNCNAIIEKATNTLILGCKNTKIPNNITTIGRSAFDGCYDLKDITIPNSVTTIGQSAFWECKNLTSITIPNSVTTIGINAFCGAGLTSITIPASVKEIDEHAFWNCTGLSSVTVSWTDAQSIVSINSNVFQGIANGAGPAGATLYVPKGTTNLYEQANVWKEFNVVDDIDKCVITYTASAQLSGAQFNPGSTTFGPAIKSHTFSNGIGVITCVGLITKIADGAFTHSGITSITLPSSITQIGMGAFEYCGQLQSITLPPSVSVIGDAAFQFTGLTSITIPASVGRIGHWAFQECPNLKEVIIPSSSPLTFIGEKAFYKTGLTSITIPALVEKIENDAFLGCPLEYVVSMSETPPTLGDRSVFPNDKNAFVYVPTPEATVAYRSSDWAKYFTNIYSYITYRQTSSNTVEVINAFPIDGKVEIPAMFASAGTFYKVIGIADSAFYEEDSLVSISLPPTIQYIGNNAFKECYRFRDINLEFTEDLQTIGDKAFYNAALDSIVIPEGVQSLGRAAFAFNTLHYVSLPTGLKNIPDECFRNCYFGTEIIVPEGVETIGANSFRVPTNFENVTLITLPSTLKEIKSYAFANRVEFEKVICLAQDPPTLGETIFTNQKTAIVYVPDRDVMKTYQNSSWKNYKFKFADLMAEENKAYLYQVADTNKTAQKIAKLYCDSIDKDTTTLQVQRHTDIALEKIDALTLKDYKQALVDSLNRYAKDNAEAMQIADQYAPQIINATSRPVAEQLFAGAYMKITDIYELIALKKDYKKQLINLAGVDEDLLKVATDYGALIDRAETKEQARALYERATMRININKQIKSDWNGGSVKVNNHTCTTTKGYDNH